MRRDATAILAGAACLALLLSASHVVDSWSNAAVLLGRAPQPTGRTQKLAYDGPYDTPPVTWYFPGPSSANTLGYNWADVQYQNPTVVYQPGVMTDNGIATTTMETVGFNTGETTSAYPLGSNVNYQYVTSQHNDAAAAGDSGVIYQYDTVAAARKHRQAALSAVRARARQQSLSQIDDAMIDLPDNDVVAGLKMKLDKLDSESETALDERMEKDKAILDSGHSRVSLSDMAKQMKDLSAEPMQKKEGKDEDEEKGKNKLVMKHDADNKFDMPDDLVGAVIQKMKNPSMDVVNMAPLNGKADFQARDDVIHQPIPGPKTVKADLGGTNIFVFGNLNIGGAAGDLASKIKGEIWSYTGAMTGPGNWSELNPSWEICDYGISQSPINLEINIQRDSDLHPLRWVGPTEPYEVTLVPPTYANTFTLEGLKGSMTISGLKMNLKRMTFHTPSEHRIHGKPMKGEIQFVHEAQVESSSVGLIVSAFLEFGDDTAQFLKAAMEGIRGFVGKDDPQQLLGSTYDPPQFEMDVKPSVWFNTQDMAEGVLGYGNNYANYFTYSGSLSRPPCTEGVTWIIVKKPIIITPYDYAILAYLQGHTARPTQRMHGRAVYETPSRSG